MCPALHAPAPERDSKKASLKHVVLSCEHETLERNRLMDISYGCPVPILQLQGSFMLVLMRKAGESIHIGPNIVVTLVSLERNRARIGIQAPRDIIIDREEI